MGIVIVTSSSSKEWASRDIGFFQNAMTLGQLIGPPLGALAASALGYKGAFMSASALVFVTLAFCLLYVVDVPHEPKEKSRFREHTVNRRTMLGWGLCFTTTVQLMFLPSVLPMFSRVSTLSKQSPCSGPGSWSCFIRQRRWWVLISCPDWLPGSGLTG